MDLITIDISGVVKWGYDADGSFQIIHLIQEDGLEINLINRFQEIIKSFGSEMQVNIWTSDSPKTKDELKRELIEYLYDGSAQAGYHSTSYFYSSYTCGTDYDSILKIGGHDLFELIRLKENKFIWIEVNYKPQ